MANSLNRELPVWLAQNGTKRSQAALVFGSEKHGLTNEDMSHCHAIVRIPTSPDTPSMNLVQAVAVCCYELARARAVREPRKVLAEFGVALPDRVAVKVWDSTAEIRYLVVPQRPAGTEGWDVKDLAKLITRDAMIGTGLVAAPS